MFRKILLLGVILLMINCGNTSKDDGGSDKTFKTLETAEAALKKKDFKKAIKNFEMALEIAEKSSKPNNDQLFQIHCGLGQAYIESKMHNNFYLARKQIIKALDLKPDDGRALFLMGVVLKSLGENSADFKIKKAAVSYLEKAAKAKPNASNVQLQLGIAYNGIGMNKEGLEAIKKASALAPKNPIIKMHLGAAYCLSKKYAEAEAEYLSILEINPEFAKVHYNLGWLYLNAEDEKFKNVDEAIRCGEIALVQEPKAAYNYELLARAYAAKGEYKKAFELCEDAVKLDPNNLGDFQQLMMNLEGKMKKEEEKDKNE